MTQQQQALVVADTADSRALAALEQRGLTLAKWRVLKDTIWPNATSKEAVLTAVDYCNARGLDPLSRPVHIVPVWDPVQRKEVERIWVGVAALLITASRTGQFAGKDPEMFGDDVTQDWDGVTVTYPEWCDVTVYRLVCGNRTPFTARVYWAETYAQKKGGVPNAMWQKRPRGQLAKCALAAVLRIAFPEETSGMDLVEEAGGYVTDTQAPMIDAPVENAPRTQAPQAPEPQESDESARRKRRSRCKACGDLIDPEKPHRCAPVDDTESATAPVQDDAPPVAQPEPEPSLPAPPMPGDEDPFF